MVKLSWEADRWRSLGAFLSVVLSPVSGTLRAVGLAVVADGVVTGDRGRALAGAMVVAGLSAASRLLEWANLALRMRLREHTILLLDQKLMRLVAGLPGLEHHERPEYADQLELLQRHRWSLVNPFLPLAWTAATVVQLVATVAVLARLHPLLLALPVAAVPSLLASSRAERRWRRLWEEQAGRERLLAHLFELGTLAQPAKEVRLFGLAPELERRHRAAFEELARARAATSARTNAMKVGGSVCFVVAYVAALLLVVDRAIRGDLSIGDVVLVLTLGTQINEQVADLGYTAAWLGRTSQAVGRYRWLVDHAARAHAAHAAHAALGPGGGAEVPERLRSGIMLHGVGFAYPGTSTPVLARIDIHLPAGSTVAVVGENGAGKTTLVKLLLRFYDATEGSITVDGVDLRRLPVEAWRARVAAGFQDFVRFGFVARESVGVGWLPDVDDEVAVAGALARAGAAGLADGLPRRLATQLGREFEGGADLSQGQWQRVALGRAMMRTRPLLLVLDEPTASLDAAAEHDLFEAIAAQARAAGGATGTVTVLVSHRFSTVRMADLILVLEGGRLVEAGSHDDLVALGGCYAELYELQARAYR
jgi:ATP-binding cassette subfamily B protein